MSAGKGSSRPEFRIGASFGLKISNSRSIIFNLNFLFAAPSFTSPEKYWFRTYRINRGALIENNRNCLEKITDVEVPDTIHGELSPGLRSFII